MIELRWHVRITHFEERVLLGSEKVERVLQYRQRLDAYLVESRDWSDWRDVPTVDETGEGK